MSWETWAVIGVAALPLGVFVFAFVVGCFERISVRMFRDAPLSHFPSYMFATVQQAQQWGFVPIAQGVHPKFGDKLAGVLLLSPDARILAVIGEGALLGMPSKKTTLFSRLQNGRILSCTDETGTAELDPASTRRFLMNADFPELLREQQKLIAEISSVPLLFDGTKGWAELDDLCERRTARVVEAGWVRYCDSDRLYYRHTLRGSFRTTIVHGIGQILRPQNHVRINKPRAG